MNFGICGKVALVTGGSHGVGLATAQALAAEGCRVAICSRSLERLAQAKQLIVAQDGPVLTVQADVLTAGCADKVVEQVVAAFGTIDILVNNVGGGGSWGKDSFEETDPFTWREVMDKNLLAAVEFTRLAVPYMRRSKWGRVVTVSSYVGREGGGRPWYSAAKAAEVAMMKGLAMRPELVRDGLTFNSVAPGDLMIPETGWAAFAASQPEAFAAYVDGEIPLGRMGDAAEVANVIAFMCSAQASFMNGSCVAVDGGKSRAF